MAANEPLASSNNGFDEWQSVDERNGSDKSSNSGSQNSSSWYLVQVRFLVPVRDVLCILLSAFNNLLNYRTLCYV